MATDQERGIGIRGLNLAVDPAQLGDGALTVADGVRYYEAGAAFSRGGRVRAGLDFPDEGLQFGVPLPYVSSIPHFRSSGPCRGFIPFYDQRIWPTNSSGYSNPIPQRLNFLEKVGSSLNFNGDTVDSGTGILSGDGTFADPNTRCKMIVYGNRAYIADSKTPAKVFRQLPSASQTFLSRVKYSALPMGIKWPTAGNSDPTDATQKPVVVAATRVIVADFTTDTFTSANPHGLNNGDVILISSTGIMPGGIFVDRLLYVRDVTSLTFKVENAALAGVINITSNGTGTISFAPILPLGVGIYRFRIVLENVNGTRSSPSMYVQYAKTAADPTAALFVQWSTISATFPTSVTRVRLYVQYTIDQGAATLPSAYSYVGDAAVASGATGIPFKVADAVDQKNRELMPLNIAAPPILRDIAIAGGIAYGAADLDTIYREVEEGQALTTTVTESIVWRTGAGAFNVYTTLTAKTKIVAIPVNRSYLFLGAPGEPENMYSFRPVANGSEQIVGLMGLGPLCVIFTNEGIHTYDRTEDRINSGFSHVGCISRDSIVATEQGIRFVATDGVPRLFNGATVEHIADELLPIFDRDDYIGDYSRFDKANAQEIVGTYGSRKFFMVFPVGGNKIYKPGQEVAPGAPRYLAIGDNSHGQTQWSIDRKPSYHHVYWLGRESRLLAIDADGYHYFIEEGLIQQNPVDVADETPYMELSTRRFAGGGVQAQFYKVKLDVNTQGQMVGFYAEIDDNPAISVDATFSTVRRDEVTLDLPANFKGRYMKIKFFGNVGNRFAIYGILPEVVTRGVV